MKYCVYEGRCLQFGRFRYDRRIVPVCLGLADFLGTYGFPIYHFGVHEYLADSALDGGHVMFLIYEVVARRKPSDKFLEYAQMAGMFILFALLIYANGNDIFRFFFK